MRFASLFRLFLLSLFQLFPSLPLLRRGILSPVKDKQIRLRLRTLLTLTAAEADGLKQRWTHEIVGLGSELSRQFMLKL